MSTSLTSATTDTTVGFSPVKSNIGVPPYVVTRFLLLRLLGLVYATAFLILIQQQDPLISDGGILPAGRYLARIEAVVGSRAGAMTALPTLFWLDASDGARHVAAWTGFVLSLAVLSGATNALLQLALWALYLSFVQVGQLFYGYGWE